MGGAAFPEIFKGLVKKYRGGGGVGRSREGVGHEVLGWVVQFSATLRGWVTLFYNIDGHTFKSSY